ncbi:MAG: C69 family dipeptidase [Elusimicrobiota bacterium]|nr:C69 family dipeptidase [Elusimicrobiota bacterium]
MKKFLCLILSVVFILNTYQYVFACTTMIVTKGASADGSVFVAHSDDDDLADQSIIYVPAKDYPKGAKRAVHGSAVAVGELGNFKDFLVPRLVDAERSPDYAYPGQKKSIPIGYIPQVEHTYAYLDGNYGIINEYGLMFGECTDGAKVTNAPNSNRLFYSAELSRIALERCKTAREAVELIGSLIEEYGYYGTGETLPVADSKEAWVIEMAPSPEGKGGLWVAQKVPDGQYFIAANEFRIREIIPGNPDQLYGKTLFDTVARNKMRVPADTSKNMDWLATVSKGEYSHPYYSLRRVWRGLSLAAPSLKLSPWVKDGGLTRDYPFSVKPDKKMTLADIKRIYRDHYEGTEFDLTKGAAAGPFGNPTRYLGPKDPGGDVGDPNAKLEGAWERPISMFYTGYVFINQNKPGVPFPLNAISWIALDTPAESVFVPLPVAKTPASYARADTRKYDADSAFWTYNLVSEYANLKYSYMIKDIQARATIHEKNSEALVNSLIGKLSSLAAKNPQAALDAFSKSLNENAENIRQDWKNLFFELVAKYNQGFINSPSKMAQRVGYPEEWLKNTNYKTGPVSYEKQQ